MPAATRQAPDPLDTARLSSFAHVMETSRSPAKRRLEAALERHVGLAESESANLYELRIKLALIAHEKRFLLLTYLMHHEGAFSSQHLASAIADRHTNVVKHLSVMRAAGIIQGERETATTIAHYSLNKAFVERLARFFVEGPTAG